MLKGTEKQIKYAEDILLEVNNVLDELEKAVGRFSKNEERAAKAYAKHKEMKEYVNGYTVAGDVINDFKEVLKGKKQSARTYAVISALKEKGIKMTVAVSQKLVNEQADKEEEEEWKKYGIS